MKKIITNFIPSSGFHCITNSLKQIFNYNGKNFSEEMLFGLASGLNFFYFDFKFSPIPMIGGRIKILDFEENLAQRLKMKIIPNETTSNKRAYTELKKLIENDIPVMIYTDMCYLSYLNMPEDYHFGGHSIVVFGIDEDDGVAYVSDRDGKDFKVTMNPDEIPQDFHIIPLEELAKARGSKAKPYPPKNRWFTYDFSEMKELNRQMMCDCITINIESMINTPIKNLGLEGIKLFSEKVKEWSDFEDDLLKNASINAFVMINEVGGNGGGCFRKMYGRFLIEASKILGDPFLVRAGEEYEKIGNEWDVIGNHFYKVFETKDRKILNKISDKVFMLYIKETELMEIGRAHV